MDRSDHSSRGPEAKLVHVEFPDLHVSKKDSVEIWRNQLKSQLFEAEYLADEDSGLVPADVSAIVHPSQKWPALIFRIPIILSQPQP
jgi:hypothetical protein